MKRPRMIVIGGSAGTLDALSHMLKPLPATLAVTIVIVTHRAPDSRGLAEVLQHFTAMRVCEVDDKQPIESGMIYLAPADYHLLLEGDHFTLTTDEPVLYSRPSIDVTMESAADAWGGPGLAGVVITGANHDGAAGLRRIASRGGEAVVQDPDEADVAVMPLAALAAVPTAKVLTVEEITRYIVDFAGEAAEPARTA